MMDILQRQMWKSRVVNFVHRLYQTAQQLETGGEVNEDTLDSLLSQLDEMAAAVQQLTDEHSELPDLFERGIHRLSKQLGERDLGKGIDYAQRGELDLALPLYKRAYDRFVAMQDIQGQGVVLSALAQVHEWQDQYAKAKRFYKQALTCFQKSGDRTKEYQVAFQWGNMCYQQSQFPQARKLYLQGIQLAQADSDGSRVAEGQRLLGRSWEAEGLHDEAIPCYQMALKLAREAGSRDEQLRTWHSLGSLYSSLGNRQESLRCYKKALTLAQKSAYADDRITILVKMNLLYQALGHKKEAWQCWKEAERLVPETHPGFEQVVQQARPEEE